MRVPGAQGRAPGDRRLVGFAYFAEPSEAARDELSTHMHITA